MKANEIQIGDWLYYKGQFNAFPFKVESITKKKVGYHAEPNEHHMYYLRLSECKPIPLIPEILERNGFDNVIWQGEASWSYHENEVYVCISGRSGGIKHFGYNGWDSKIAISSVHELQHALRLCGIDKNIVL